MNLTQQSSRSSPRGATVVDGGVNFSGYSSGATAVELLLFDSADDNRPGSVIRIDPVTNRSYHYWHTFVPDLQPGQLYAYRVYGAFDPKNGLRFNPVKVLLILGAV